MLTRGLFFLLPSMWLCSGCWYTSCCTIIRDRWRSSLFEERVMHIKASYRYLLTSLASVPHTRIKYWTRSSCSPDRNARPLPWLNSHSAFKLKTHLSHWRVRDMPGWHFLMDYFSARLTSREERHEQTLYLSLRVMKIPSRLWRAKHQFKTYGR